MKNGAERRSCDFTKKLTLILRFRYSLADPLMYMLWFSYQCCEMDSKRPKFDHPNALHSIGNAFANMIWSLLSLFPSQENFAKLPPFFQFQIHFRPIYLIGSFLVKAFCSSRKFCSILQKASLSFRFNFHPHPSQKIFCKRHTQSAET